MRSWTGLLVLCAAVIGLWVALGLYEEAQERDRDAIATGEVASRTGPGSEALAAGEGEDAAAFEATRAAIDREAALFAGSDPDAASRGDAGAGAGGGDDSSQETRRGSNVPDRALPERSRAEPGEPESDLAERDGSEADPDAEADLAEELLDIEADAADLAERLDLLSEPELDARVDQKTRGQQVTPAEREQQRNRILADTLLAYDFARAKVGPDAPPSVWKPVMDKGYAFVPLLPAETRVQRLAEAKAKYGSLPEL